MNEGGAGAFFGYNYQNAENDEYTPPSHLDQSQFGVTGGLNPPTQTPPTQIPPTQTSPPVSQNPPPKTKTPFMKIFDVSKIGHPSRPGENSVDGDPVWADAQYGISQFVDPAIRKNSIGFYDNDFGPYFYGRGFLKVCQKPESTILYGTLRINHLKKNQVPTSPLSQII